MTSRRRRPAEPEGAVAAEEPDRGAVAKLSDEQRRALRRLARRPDGCAEAELLVDDFTIGQLTDLVIDGLATGTVAGTALDGRETPVVWMKITKVGRKAIGE
jgi:hypothetical protein